MLEMRKICRQCGSQWGRITEKNGQDCVYCDGCGRWQYNAPRTETGRKQRSVQTTHRQITPKQRFRILERASGRCEVCGKDGSGCALHVGHVISVDDGHKHGLSDDVINDDENLICLCDECNLGQGSMTLSLRQAVSILVARTTKG